MTFLSHARHRGHPRFAMRGGSQHDGAHRGGGRGDGMRGDGGRGRRRVFDSGEFRLVLLALIAEGPRHGYDLIRAIEARSGGAYAPSPGVIYPTLTLLADMGQTVETPGDGGRKAFAITDEGRAALAAAADEIEALFGRLDALGAMRARTDGAPVRRAMHNLRAVLMHRLGREEVDADTVHAAVALIDEAAQRIERL